MWPIIACSVIAMAIIVERLWAYRPRKVLPSNLVAQIWQLHQNNQLTSAHVATVRNSSPLGRILAAGLVMLSGSAMATNGYFTHGVGTESKGMAGTGVGSPSNLGGIAAATNPALIELVVFPGADHVRSWNADRARYEGTLGDFLVALRR